MKTVYQHVFAADKQNAGAMLDTFFKGVAEGKNAHGNAHENKET